MEFFFNLLTFLFVAMVIVVAVTIGVSLLLWFAVLGVALSIFMALRRRWERWQFEKESDAAMSGTIIDVQFEELKDRYNP